MGLTIAVSHRYQKKIFFREMNRETLMCQVFVSERIVKSPAKKSVRDPKMGAKLKTFISWRKKDTM